MKKIGIVIALIILTFSFSVKADVFMEIDCSDNKVNDKNATTCEVNLVYEEVSIDDIEFEYVTNLDIEFSSISGFNLNKNGNKVSIHSSTTLYDDMMNSDHIVKFTLKANSNCQETESLTLKNIKINNSNEESVSNVSKTFNVTLEETSLDSNCYLNSITIDNVSLSGFDKNKFEYRGINVNKNIVYIDATRSSEKSSATGLGEEFIKPGETLEHEIEVTAQDKTRCVYKLFITNKNNSTETDDDTNSIGMELSKDNTLKSLELYNGKEKIPFTFNNKKDNFDIVVENSELTKITIKATTTDAKATFTDKYGPRDVSVSQGENKILIKVKAENNDEKTYTLNITLKESKDSDNTLSSLIINDEVVKLVEGVDSYEITLPKEVEKTKIEAVPTNEKAKVEFKDIDLVEGNNQVTITVIAEDNSKKEYHVDITRSDKNILKEIKVDGYNLGFTKDEKDYTLKINQEETSLKIMVTPSNIDYEIIGNEELQDGSIVTIKVNDANGTSEYKITIIKDTNKISIVVCGIIILIMIAIVILIILLIRKKRRKRIDKYIDVI